MRDEKDCSGLKVFCLASDWGSFIFMLPMEWRQYQQVAHFLAIIRTVELILWFFATTLTVFAKERTCEEIGLIMLSFLSIFSCMILHPSALITPTYYLMKAKSKISGFHNYRKAKCIIFFVYFMRDFVKIECSRDRKNWHSRVLIPIHDDTLSTLVDVVIETEEGCHTEWERWI